MQCYRRLCQSMHNSSVACKWSHLKTNNVPGMFLGSGGNSVLSSLSPNNLKELIEEGNNLSDRFSLSDSNNCKMQTKHGSFTLNTQTNLLSANPNLMTASNDLNSNIKEIKSNGKLHEDSHNNGSIKQSAVKEVTEKGQNVAFKSNTQPQTTIIRLATPSSSISTVSSQSLINANVPISISGISVPPSAQIAGSHLKLKCKMRRGCRCGLATPNPGKLTCCGQRCPCYVEGKACVDCKCRGCRNPNKTEQAASFTSRNLNAITSHSGSSLFLKSPSIQISTVSQNHHQSSSASNRELPSSNILASNSSSTSCNANVSSTAGQLIRSGIISSINIISSAASSYSPQLAPAPSTAIIGVLPSANSSTVNAVPDSIFSSRSKFEFLSDESTQVIIPAANISVGAEETTTNPNDDIFISSIDLPSVSESEVVTIITKN